jgi:hypothetical protein
MPARSGTNVALAEVEEARTAMLPAGLETMADSGPCVGQQRVAVLIRTAVSIQGNGVCHQNVLWAARVGNWRDIAIIYRCRAVIANSATTTPQESRCNQPITEQCFHFMHPVLITPSLCMTGGANSTKSRIGVEFCHFLSTAPCGLSARSTHSLNSRRTVPMRRG